MRSKCTKERRKNGTGNKDKNKKIGDGRKVRGKP